MKTQYREIEPYLTKDNSTIRELMHPDHHGDMPVSLAEASIPAGTTTRLHRHHASTEYYHVTGGQGEMSLDEECFPITAGDTVLIRPGQVHQVTNTGKRELTILCVCSPPYSHGDTELV
jgi:mannose-6-phosphate isomerase-like protein (cupin superfamily)